MVSGGVEVVEVEEGFRLRNLSRPRRIDLEPEAEIVASVVEAGASSVWVRGLKGGRLFRIELGRDLGASGVWVEVETSGSEDEVEASGLNAAGEEVKFRVDIVSGSGSNLKKLLT